MEQDGLWKSKMPGRIWQVASGQLACTDAHTFLRSLRSECADIIFLDPPFNLGKRYGARGSKADRLKEKNYEKLLTSTIIECVRLLKRGGALYLYHLPLWAMRFGNVLESQGLSFRHWIAISMKSGFARGAFLYPAHYALVYFTKGRPQVFERPKVSPQLCRHCGKEIKDYGGYAKFIAGGINLGDIWDDLSPVRHKKYKNGSSNELPLELTRRIVQISGLPNGLLIDPFAGSGTSLVSAVEAGMRFAASEREEANCEVVLQRLDELESQRIKEELAS